MRLSHVLRLAHISRIRLLRLPPRKPSRLSRPLWHTILGLRITLIGEPSSVGDMPKAAFYAVAVGRKPGVYHSWAEAEAQVKGYPAAKYKKFATDSEARSFVSSSSTGPYGSVSATATATTTATAGPSKRIPVISKTNGDKRPTIRNSSPPTDARGVDLTGPTRKLYEKGYTVSRRGALVVYCDGSSIGNGKRGAVAGLGVWWGSDREAASKNISERVPGLLQTNNRGELLAVIRALEDCPYPDMPVEIRTDSQYTIACMTLYLPKWIRNGFCTARSSEGGGKGVKNVDLIKHLLVLLRRRGPNNGVTFKYVPGHSGVEGNEGADRLARMGAMLPPAPDRTYIDPDDPEDDPGSPRVDADRALVELDIDEDWVLNEDEMRQLEEDFA